MPNPVTEKVELPSLAHADKAIQNWVGALIRNLTVVIFGHGQRINTSLNQDGKVPMQAPFQLKTYTTAELPAAADWPASIVFVSDAAAGQKFQGSDGSAWVPLG